MFTFNGSVNSGTIHIGDGDIASKQKKYAGARNCVTRGNKIEISFSIFI